MCDMTRQQVEAASTMASAVHPATTLRQEDCTLNVLPGELRNIIWVFLLAERKPHLHLENGNLYDTCAHEERPDRAARARRSAAKTTSILRTYRALFAEVSPILYETTAFELVLHPDRISRLDLITPMLDSAGRTAREQVANKSWSIARLRNTPPHFQA